MDNESHLTRDVAGDRFRSLGALAVAVGLGILAVAAAYVDPGAERRLAGTDIAAQLAAIQDPVKQDPAGPGMAGAVELAKATLDKIVETERNLAAARRDWALGKEMLGDRIGLMKREIDKLEGDIAKVEGNITLADEKRVGLVDENENLKRSVAALADRIAGLETRLVALLPRLPEPIQEKVKPLSQRLPKPGTEIKASLGDRFSYVVAILNEVDKFHQEVTVVSEVRTLSDGRSAEVTAMYVGVAFGFFVNAAGTAAGIGTSSVDGWEWIPADDSAPQIARAIAIVEGREPAAFVPLPLEIR